MSLEEKYDRLFDLYLLNIATFYSLHKELGIVDKCVDWSLKVQKKMLPSGIRKSAFKLLKAIAPGKAMSQLIKQYMCTLQTTIPLSNIEMNMASDREVTMRFKNCPELIRMRDVVKKAGLDLDPKLICEKRCKGVTLEVVKTFGADGTGELEENGCIWTFNLK